MIPQELVKILHEVDEKLIVDAANWVGEGENNFKKLLKKAKMFKDYGCTPFFLANEDHTAFCVSSEETYDKKLH